MAGSFRSASAPLRSVASDGIALSPDGAMVFVVNPDSGSISTISTQTNAKTGELGVCGQPRQLALSAGGAQLYVTCQQPPLLAIVDTRSMSVTDLVAVNAEPYGVVAGRAGEFVYVASSATSNIDVVELGGLEVQRSGAWFWHDDTHTPPPPHRPGHAHLAARIPVAGNPKGLALSADEAQLYVTHFFTGQISAIATATRQILNVFSIGGDSNALGKVAVNPANGRIYLPHIRSNTANVDVEFNTTVAPVLSVVDVATGQDIDSERVELSAGSHSVNLPSDVAFSPDGKRAYVVNMGSGEMSVVDLALSRRIADVDVGDGPRGIAVTADGATAYIWNSLSDDVSVVDLAALREIKRVTVTTSPLPGDVRRGRVFFFSSRSPQISKDRWLSCGSCHFDGETDGRTWFFDGSGMRNTITVRGSGDTRPLHWSADRDEFQDFEFTIRQLQGGTGLIVGRDPNPPLGPPNAGLSADLDALAAYCASVQVKPSPFTEPADAIARGRAIFMRADTGCSTCHAPPLYTDSNLRTPVKHDVGTGGEAELNGNAFDTPSLRMLWDTAPYLHNGTAPTLRDVLVTSNPTNQHGHTSQLSPVEIQDLIAFLLSL